MAQDSASSAPAHSDSSEPLHIVGLGASAGGVTAMKQFFAHVRPDSGAAYVAILHLSPEHESRLAEVLQVTAPMPVTQVTARVRVEKDHVYVIPPNKTLEIADGHLVVKEFTRAEQRRAPVDLFFRTLAEAHGPDAVCIVLSGTGPNGSAGLKLVKEFGGLAIAQDPSEAEYGDMPRNSIATGLVDYILPVAEMPRAIGAYYDRVRTGREGEAEPTAGGEGEVLREILALLAARTGHDFSNYKSSTLRRRVERRLSLRGEPTLAGYARLLRHEPGEAMSLMKELLISVTSFFRDEQAWRVLEERVIPRLFAGKGMHDQVRVWVPGCATGEEAYTVAMLLADYVPGAVGRPSIQVFATDLDAEAIAVGRAGFYSEAEVVDISEGRLTQFFTREPGGYRVTRELREMVLFAHHNVIKDPPFSHLDLISCRNLLIYLNRHIQERVIETFHFALRPDGYLFLGASESTDGSGELFMRVDGPAHIYESRSVTSRLALPLGSPLAHTLTALPPEARPTDRIAPAHLHHRLLEEYAPPSLVVSDDHNVVHMSDRVGRFLLVPGGEPTRDLLTLVRPELRPDLRQALHQAATERRAVAVSGILVSMPDGEHRVRVSVRPVLRDGDPARGFFLVVFDESAAVEIAEPPPVSRISHAEPLTRQLEEELARAKLQLRATVEQYETQVEEAKASNEELQAMNEELRSAAEELETSREELQSVNEELTTVNQELKIKIEELGLTNNDFQNFINATDIGTIFLDRGLRVKFSTPRAQEVFNLLATDIGRPLSDITSRLRYDRIHADVATVLDRLQSIEREVQTHDGRWHLMRLLPYRTSDDRIDGVVLTFQDITGRRRAEEQVRSSEERMRLLIDSATDFAILTLTEAGRIDSWSLGAERLFGYSAEEAIGADFGILFTPEDRERGVHLEELERARRVGRATDERYHMRRNGTRFYSSGVTTRLGGDGQGFAKIARDLTRQREAAETLRVARDTLEERVRTRTGELEAEVARHEAAKQDVSDLLRRVVHAQEEERSRIARDLHDNLGQQLTGVRLVLERLQTGGQAADVEKALAITEQIGRDSDFLIWELRPSVLDELGLAAALPRFVREWSAHVGLPVEVTVDTQASDQLASDVQVTFYRVAQEALHNIAKHAHASRADVLLTARDGHLTLVIEDDGIGFDAESSRRVRGVGLASMRERAALVGASLHVESSPGNGTTVYLRFAVDAPPR